MTNHVAEAADTAPAPVDKRPILSRFVPVTISADDGEQKTQPRLGATLKVVNYKGEQSTIWFPATVWQGIATIIRQTPDHLRPNVAEFLMVLHSTLGIAEPLASLMEELIAEVQHDPYGDMPETPRSNFDAAW